MPAVRPKRTGPGPELEDAYFHVLSPLGLPITDYNDFVARFRMYYPPLQYQKYLQKGQFCTASGKVELKCSVFEEFGLPAFPKYIGPAENEIDDPEVAAEYPIVLTTGGGFMPFHHSEHFNNPIIRYIKPDPYFTIHPDLALTLGIEMGDWCWDRDPSWPHQDARQRRAGHRSACDLHAARLVVPRA